MPLILGEERLIPGSRPTSSASRSATRPSSTSTSRTTTRRPTWPAQPAHFAVDLASCARRSCPSSTTTSSATLGDFADLDALRAEIRQRLERNALDRARHGFADRIIEYAVANATLELPDILVDQEVEVMHDEFRGTLARQGITEEAYLKATTRPTPTCTPNSVRAPRSGSRPCWSSRRSPRSRA